MKQKGSNISTIKTENNSLILNCIRRRAMSRAEISKSTGLSKSAVTIITKQLIDEGQLMEIGTESISYGRHPILLDIVKTRRYAMGIALDRARVTVCIVNLKLQSVDSRCRDISEFDAPDKAVLWAYQNGLEILDEKKISRELCVGIGVAAPGPLDYKRGVILTPPNFELFRDFDVRGCLAAYSDMPVFVNNTPVLMAMYERCKREPELNNYIYVTVDNGVGSAIFQNGRVNMGSAGFSGEIGHTTVDVNGPVCSCGNYGCLEGYVTKKAFLKLYGIDYEENADKAYSGDREALDRIVRLARYFASGIINSVNMLDLDTVIISGELNYRYELLFEQLQNNINERSIITKAHKVTVLPALAENSAFSAVNVIEHYFSAAGLGADAVPQAAL